MSNPLYDYRATYQNMPDGKLLGLAQEEQSLMPEARVALWAEMDRRGIADELTRAGKPESKARELEHRLNPPKRIAEWKLEPELAGPIPRHVVPGQGCVTFANSLLLILIFALPFWLTYFFSGMRTEINLFTLLFLLSGPYGVLIALGRFIEWVVQQSYNSLVIRGTPARGVVVSVHKWFKTNPRTSTKSPRYDYVIAYETPDRRRIAVTLNEEFHDVPVGHTLTVLYLPDAPMKARPYIWCCYKAL